MGGVFSSSFLFQTTFKSKLQRESPIDYWSNYATMKLFEGHSSQYLSLITLERPFPALQSQIAGISFLECRSEADYFADSNLRHNQFSSMPIAMLVMALPHDCDLCLGLFLAAQSTSTSSHPPHTSTIITTTTISATTHRF